MEGSNNINTQNNIVYVLLDMLESNLIDLEQLMAKEKFMLRHDVKRNFTFAIDYIKKGLKRIKELKKDLKHCDEEAQIAFGEEADIYNLILLTLIDRTGDNKTKMFQLYNYIYNQPSVLNLNLEAYKDAFK